jgi:hypothetical protein
MLRSFVRCTQIVKLSTAVWAPVVTVSKESGRACLATSTTTTTTKPRAKRSTTAESATAKAKSKLAEPAATEKVVKRTRKPAAGKAGAAATETVTPTQSPPTTEAVKGDAPSTDTSAAAAQTSSASMGDNASDVDKAEAGALMEAILKKEPVFLQWFVQVYVPSVAEYVGDVDNDENFDGVAFINTAYMKWISEGKPGKGDGLLDLTIITYFIIHSGRRTTAQVVIGESNELLH